MCVSERERERESRVVHSLWCEFMSQPSVIKFAVKKGADTENSPRSNSMQW